MGGTHAGCVTLGLVRAPLLGPAPVRALVHAAVGDNSRGDGDNTRTRVMALLPHVLRQHFIGDVSPQADPRRFVVMVQALYNHWRDSGCAVAGVPLVINTQGWVKGMGLDLLTECLQHTRPSHLLQVSAPTARAENIPRSAPARAVRHQDDVWMREACCRPRLVPSAENVQLCSHVHHMLHHVGDSVSWGSTPPDSAHSSVLGVCSIAGDGAQRGQEPARRTLLGNGPDRRGGRCLPYHTPVVPCHLHGRIVPGLPRRLTSRGGG